MGTYQIASKKFGQYLLIEQAHLPPVEVTVAVDVRDWRCSMVEKLLMHGADVNATDQNGETALHVAIAKERPDRAVILLSFGADPDIADLDGNTPRSLAKAQNMIEILELM